MTISALVLVDSPIRLWGLSSKERLRRQIRQLNDAASDTACDVVWLESAAALPPSGPVLLLKGSYLFEIRTLQGLLQHPGSVLFCSADGQPAAALVDASAAEVTADYLCNSAENGLAVDRLRSELPGGLRQLGADDILAFDEALRSARQPVLEPISAERKTGLENMLYGNAYRGITDLVTKFVWPRPARQLVYVCARLGLSPNQVTSIGLALVFAASWFFLEGHYLAGLTAGWIMTLLDTVDGKLARVTIQSSPFGHIYDHAIDLIHPPFWYIFWGMSLTGLPEILGLDFNAMCWLLIAAYVFGRIAEGLFSLLGDCSIFTWQPVDAWFRLITARRNPCLILLTASVLFGHPDWGFIAVVGWSALTTIVLLLRLVQGAVARVTRGPLKSWLSVADVAESRHARSFRIFGGTRGAYGR